MSESRCSKVFLTHSKVLGESVDHVLTDLIKPTSGCRSDGANHILWLRAKFLYQFSDRLFNDALCRASPARVNRCICTCSFIADQHRYTISRLNAEQYFV